MVTATVSELATDVRQGRGGARASGLTRHDFFADVVQRLRALLPDELRDFQHKSNMSLLKIYYGNERVHFEVWINTQHGLTEIGLHFEDGPLSTADYLAYFDGQIVELKHVLGPSIELERWTTSWGHLFEMAPLAPLNVAYVDKTSRRLAALITELQPRVDAAMIAGERAAQAAAASRDRRRWRKK